ncbi:MAG: hypothetical protein KJ025_00810 [Burkholderiales bacterium]|nr:hypothetical protein [Burkholderiales bacterium]
MRDVGSAMAVAGASTRWTSGDGALRRVVYASANLLHRFTPTLIIGGELVWGEATDVDGVSATNTRIQLPLRHLVFWQPAQ